MLTWITANWMEISGVLALAIVFFERVSRLTPTDMDDKVVQFVRKLANVLSINVPDIK